MRVFVTGSHGFVGRHLVTALRERGDRIYVADKKIGLDLAVDQAVAYNIVSSADPDVIVHLASSCSTPGSLADPLGTFTDTVLSAVYVMEAAREHHVPVVMTSSVKARDGMTPYGASKRMVETWCQEYRDSYGMSVVINRPGTIYGPGQDGSPESGWISWFLRAKEEDLEVTINGDGGQVRDLLHVSDYVELLLQQIDNPVRYEGLWDVGGGDQNAVSVIEMAEYLGLRYVFGPTRQGDARVYVGINDVPDWEPRIKWVDVL